MKAYIAYTKMKKLLFGIKSICVRERNKNWGKILQACSAI